MRWEWRTVADAPPPFPVEEVRESDELYLLSATGASVKVRGGQLDVKVLERVHDGLELWHPVVKADFPLEEDAAAAAAEALGAAGSAATLDELRALPGVRAVEVHKRREHFHVDGCMAERAELRTPAGAVTMIAAESEDPEEVLAAVERLGLKGRPNVSVPRALAELS